MPTLRKSRTVKGILKKQRKKKNEKQAVPIDSKMVLTDDLLRSWILDYNGTTSQNEKQEAPTKQDKYCYVTQVETQDTFISDSSSSVHHCNDNDRATEVRRRDSKSDQAKYKELHTAITPKSGVAHKNACKVNKYLSCSVDIDDDNVSSSSFSSTSTSSSLYSQQDTNITNKFSKKVSSLCSANDYRSSDDDYSSASSCSSSQYTIRNKTRGETKYSKRCSSSSKNKSKLVLSAKFMNLLYCSKDNESSDDNGTDTTSVSLLNEDSKVKDKLNELSKSTQMKEVSSKPKHLEDNEDDSNDNRPIGASLEEIQAINESIQILTDLNNDDTNIWKVKSDNQNKGRIVSQQKKEHSRSRTANGTPKTNVNSKVQKIKKRIITRVTI